jgi:hypothetical protein
MSKVCVRQLRNNPKKGQIYPQVPINAVSVPKPDPLAPGEIGSGETWNANRHMWRRRHAGTPNTAFMPAGVGGKNGTRFAIKFSGQIKEVSEKN